MAFYTTQATICTADNVVANFATNTFHFEAGTSQDLTNVHSALVTFYQAIDGLMSPLVKTTDGLILTSYDDTDPIPRPPVLETKANLTPGVNDPLPTQLAIVMSFQGERQAGVPQARRRGRVYLPFLREAINDAAGRPDSTSVATVVAAGDALLAASQAAAGWTWLIFSRVAPGYTEVTNGWVDNEFDIQRRRGREATSRSVFS